MEVLHIAKPDEPRINEEIRSPQCRLIGVDGSQLGIFAIRDAQRVAEELADVVRDRLAIDEAA